MSKVSFSNYKNIKPDKFQLDAISFVNLGFSVLVSSATGSGKTLIAEYGIEKYLNLNMSVIYTTPIKALSNQKYDELSEIYGENTVGLITGDLKLNPLANLTVMTAEVLRNQLYSKSVRSDLGLVILDEVHFIKDRFRGGTWEEIVINLNKNVPIICLSATISNQSELGRWIGSVHGNTYILKHSKRPIPLNSGIYYLSSRDNYAIKSTNLGNQEPKQITSASVKKNIKKLDRLLYSDSVSGVLKPNRYEIIDYLHEKNRLPAIYFIFSRNRCDLALNDYIKFGVPLIDRNQRSKVNQFAQEFLSEITPKDQRTLKVDLLLKGLSLGVATHHAGVVVPLKQLVEKLFAMGLIKVVFATETLSTGINMPARSVVIDSYMKRDDVSLRRLDSFEFTQMAGRAGRRGLDSMGWVILPLDYKVTPSLIYEIANNSDHRVVSNFRPNYNVVLNILSRFQKKEATTFLNNTLAAFQNQGDLTKEFNQRIKILTDFGYLKEYRVTESGSELKNIYSESDILLHQFFNNFKSDSLDPESLCAVIAACIFENRTSNRKHPTKARDNFYLTLSKNPIIEKALIELINTYNNIKKHEIKYNFVPTKEPDPGFVYAILTWMNGYTLDRILDSSNLSPGEFIKNIRTVIDLINQLKVSLNDANLRRQLIEVESRLDRDIVTLSGNLINNTTSN
jgi:superfamily II RNA helicase